MTRERLESLRGKRQRSSPLHAEAMGEGLAEQGNVARAISERGEGAAAKGALRRMRRRKPLITAFWHQAELFG